RTQPSVTLWRAALTSDAYDPHPIRHSFPTRRSSDLGVEHIIEPQLTQRCDHLPGHQRPRLQAELLSQRSTHGRRCLHDDRLIWIDRKSTRLNSSHVKISYAVSCLKKKTAYTTLHRRA